MAPPWTQHQLVIEPPLPPLPGGGRMTLTHPIGDPADLCLILGRLAPHAPPGSLWYIVPPTA
jgi:hypothetical protein